MLKTSCHRNVFMVKGLQCTEGEIISTHDYVCAVCGEEHGLDDVHHVDIKGQPKVICNECATAIKGLI